ncbi:hypothetical protein LTR36_004061 [Oleoguttula mirabilis]|uniref:Ribosomal protein L1 n=1 Tax=Oleoguttula mirabilis TaxID=1507867 RepID=A0AAV9JHN4_9PEZI|nr:hypothetical protein LTR36_004061 [Oleoguttula mirabilis]
MAPETSTVVAKGSTESPYKLNPSQTLRASTALLRKIQTDETTHQSTTEKPSLLADADEEDVEDDVPVWLVLTTKKHIVDKKRLKPGKIVLPHPFLDAKDETLRICLITADPQRKYKDLVTYPSFPLELGKRIQRVMGVEKLKTKYKAYEARRQLLGEYDVFLADDRIITYLPQVLGKVFYKSGSKRPIPVSLEGKRQSKDEQGNKRRKLSEGGTKVVKTEVKPTDVAHEIERALSSALVHLAPSTTTAVKVGKASMEPAHLQENVEAAVAGLVERYVPQQWRNVRSVHIKGPNTVALPIWLADELWENEQDVLDEAPPVKEKTKKRKRGALAEAADEPATIEVPGPDGQMRTLENPAKRKKNVDDAEPATKPAKQQQSDSAEEIAAKAAEKAEKKARKEALKTQKEDAKKAASTVTVTKTAVALSGDGKKVAKKARTKAADQI